MDVGERLVEEHVAAEKRANQPTIGDKQASWRTLAPAGCNPEGIPGLLAIKQRQGHNALSISRFSESAASAVHSPIPGIGREHHRQGVQRACR